MLEKLFGAKKFGDFIVTYLVISYCSCFFECLWPPFYRLNYCPHILGMFDINHFCTCHLFLAKWLSYSYKCNSTCWDWHFFILDGTMRYLNHVTSNCPLSSPTFRKLNDLVLSPVASFFGKSPTWVEVYLTSNKCFFKYHASMFPLRSRSKCIVIGWSYHAYISFILSPFPYGITYPLWLVTSYNCPFFTMSMWSYHWQSKYPFVLMPL
jgi:hypothetical protein